MMTEFAALRPKTYSYLTDDCEDDKCEEDCEERSVLYSKYLNLVIIKIAY